MSKFQITKELLNGYCQAGLTVVEMAAAITTASGYKCSEGTVRKACTAYGIDLRRKPQKSPFTFGDSAYSNEAPQNNVIAEERTEENVQDTPGVRF